MLETRTTRKIRVGTHTGEKPEEDKGSPRCCHLVKGQFALCGELHPWGISFRDPTARQSPCTCGLPRCPECLAELGG